MRELKKLTPQNKCSNCVYCQYKDDIELFLPPIERYNIKQYCYYDPDEILALEAPQTIYCEKYQPHTDMNFTLLVDSLTELYLKKGYETELDEEGNLVFKGTEWIIAPKETK